MIHWAACNVHIDSESAGTYCQLVFRRIRAVSGGCLPPHPLGRVRRTATYIESGRGGRISQLSRPFLRDATRVAVLAPGPMTVRALPAGGPPPSRDPDRTQRPRRSGADTRRPTRRASRDSWDSQALTSHPRRALSRSSRHARGATLVGHPSSAMASAWPWSNSARLPVASLLRSMPCMAVFLPVPYRSKIPTAVPCHQARDRVSPGYPLPTLRQ